MLWPRDRSKWIARSCFLSILPFVLRAGSYTPAVFVFLGMASCATLLLVILLVDDMRRGWPLDRPQQQPSNPELAPHTAAPRHHRHHHRVHIHTAEKGEQTQLITAQQRKGAAAATQTADAVV